ncbi:MAG: nucleotidyltransferase family protein [Chloroflexota bacterium]|nr:nucleotidyltransferase family protein [Chloroflexota bacterium]
MVLAAGGSSRLGRPKQLLPLAGRPLLAHVLRHAALSRLDEVILVLGHDAERIQKAIGDRTQRVILNPDYAAGQSTSLQAGLAAVSPTAAAALFLLGDQPQVLPSTIDALIETFRRHQSPIVLPSYGGVSGNPVLISRSLFDELEGVSGDRGARDVIRAHSGDVLRVPVRCASPPQDVDTEEDYATLLAAWPETEKLLPVGRCWSS